jgi:ubiquinone/menaquinone biosynthesis C-methylase UbiE
MKSSQLQAFENRRWNERDQELVWRHEVALKLIRDEPVLDVAGGDGLLLSLLREQKRFSQLTLLDISPVAVEKARCRSLETHVADITKPFPFPDNSFGTACALDVLEHLYDPLPTLKEMARVAQWVVLVVPNFHYWKDRARMFLGQVPFQCKPRRGHVHWFNYDMLQDLIAKGEGKVDCRIFGGFRRYGPVGDWLARWHPNLFAHSFAVRLRKS